MGAVPLMTLKASTVILNRMQAATGSQWRSRRTGGKYKNLGRLKMRPAAAFLIHYNSLVAEAGSPSKRELHCCHCEERQTPADVVVGCAGSGHSSDAGHAG